MTAIAADTHLVSPFLLRRRDAVVSVAKRDALIEALLAVFLDEGFRHLGIDDMARRLRCSNSTLYLIASSKERIIVAVVRGFFREATERVERRIELAPAGVARLQAYLSAISAELAPASAAFFADVDAFPAAWEIYQHNTEVAARRVQELVLDAVPAASRDRAVFVGTVAAQIMEAIHRGKIGARTGLDVADAYRALSDLIVSATAADANRPVYLLRSER